MRRMLLSLVLSLVAVGLLSGLAIANPQRDNSNGPHKDYIWGAATVPLPTPLGTFSANVAADATTAPNGHEGVTGTFSTGFPATPIGPISFSGVVVCLNTERLVGTTNDGEPVGSSAATWRGVVTQSSTVAVPVGAGVLARTVDNGDGPPEDPPDTNVGFLTSPPGPHPTCPQSTIPGNPITSGDLGVHDGGFTSPS